MGWSLRQWETEETDFLAVIGKGGEARVLRDLRAMTALGHLFRGDTRSLGGGLIELRVRHCGMAYRLIYVHHDNTAVFLVCFEKKKQKTPKDKLDLAKSRYSSLLRQEVQIGNIAFN